MRTLWKLGTREGMDRDTGQRSWLRTALLAGVGIWACGRLLQSYRRRMVGRGLDEVNAASDDSFPASDPPSWSGTSIR